MKLNMKIVITLLLLISLSSLVKGACNDLQKERCKKIFNIKKLSDVHCSASSGSNNGISRPILVYSTQESKRQRVCRRDLPSS